VDKLTGKSDDDAGRLSRQQLDLLVRRLDCLPTLPAVHARLVSLTELADKGRGTAGDELVRLLGCDPALTARMLRLANRDADGQVRTAAQAAERIGLSAARSAGLSTKLIELPASPGGEGMDTQAFWRHCLAVATAAEGIARTPGMPLEPDEAFTCGLLHDIGKLVLWELLPKSYLRVVEAARADNGNIADCERRIIGVDHSVVGRRLAEHWRLGRAIEQVVWMHHHPPEVVPESLPERRLVGVVALADTIARRQRFGFSGNFTFPHSCEELAAQLDLSADDVEAVVGRLASGIEQRAELLGLAKVSSESLYRDALGEANLELGRLNEQLRRQAQQSDCQARAFRHFRDFASGLSGSSTVSDALLGIAKVTAAASGPPVVAYSIGQAVDEIVAVRLGDARQVKWKTCGRSEGPFAPQPDACGEPTAEQCDALLAGPGGLLDWLDAGPHCHLPLLCASRRVGGVLYSPSDADQTQGRSRELMEALAGAMAMALAIVQGRCEAVALSEQLAGASQVLAETREALAEAKALAAVGEMAAGAAHEINTPLAVISGRAQLMARKARGGAQRNAWQLIAEQAQRISDTISDLMAFASPPRPRPEAFDVGEMLNEAKNLFRGSDHPQAASACVDIETECPAPRVWADRGQVCSAIVELIANAATAAGDRSVIRLAADADDAQDAVLLTVTDSGPGMDERTLERVFAPFFSQQAAGRRRGLGLPRVRRQVENNGGRIWIRSRLGKGTTVHVQLPTAKHGMQKERGH